MKRATVLSRYVSVAACLTISAAVFAEAPDTSSWLCQYCPFEEGHRANYDVGVSYVSDDAARFGDANGYDEKGAYLNLDGQGSIASKNYRARWVIEDVGLDSRYLSISGGRPGSFDYLVAYRQSPNHQFDTTSTIFQQNGPNSLSLPSAWVQSPLTSGFTALDSNLQRRNINSERRTLELAARYLPFERVRISAGYKRQERDGLRITAGSYFTQSSLLPAPFDFASDDADVELRYTADNGFVALTYFGSFFQNENLALRWETAFTSAPGAATGALSQSPDNSFQQVSLSGSYRFVNYDTVIGFRVGSGRLEQDDALLPYTSNPLLTTAALPRQQLDGKIDTSDIAVTLSSRPFDKARLRIGYRLNDRDNRTPVDFYERVIVDTFNSGETEVNVPYSFRKVRLSASGSYKLLPSVKIAAGYDRVEHDRDFQEVAEQTEDSGWGMLRWRPNAYIDIRAKGGAAERDIDRYDETVAISLGQNPLLRKYNLAYRYRQFGELTLAASFPEKPVSLSVSALYANDEYTLSRLGLTEGDDLRIAADVSFDVAEGRYFYLQGGYENIESDQRGSESFSDADWSARNKDSFVTLGGGLHLTEIGENLDLKVDYVHSDGETKISLNTLASGINRFPDLESRMDSLRAKFVWHKSARLAVNLGLRYERFKVEDWALEGVAPATVPVVLTLGAKPYDYDVFLIGVGFTYQLGDRGNAVSKE